MARKPEQVRPSQTIQEMYEAQPNAWIFTIAIIVAVMLLLAWSSTTLNNDNSTSIDGKAVALSIVHGLTHPNAQMLLDFSSAGVPYLLLETMCIAFLGTLVGA